MRNAILLLAAFTVSAYAAEPKLHEWTVDGVKREAFVVAPPEAKSKSSPLVFVFHGHGGSMKNSSRSMPMHAHWPEAVCIYPQGLNTPGRLTDPEGKKPGWQHSAGDQSDRDLHLFDAMLAWGRKEFKIDDKRIYATGHSNGGGFTYLLWATRGDTFAALAPSAATAVRLQKEFKPKPVLHVMGEKDTLVPFANQKAAVEGLKKLNGVEKDGKPWHDVKHAVVYTSKSGTPIVTIVHPGDHKYPEDAPKAIVRFFQEHPAAGTP